MEATLARAAASNYWTEAEAQAALEAYEASGLPVALCLPTDTPLPGMTRWVV
ncbi:hypothetical protein [Archangium violaceum]|uniref:hypothetical protein n=1 Tax=Archangium violaceum TaxID=83451 RepID=UPI0036DDCCE8